MSIKQNTRGELRAQTSEGVLQTKVLLTKQASLAIEGQALLNRAYLAVGKGPWNEKALFQPDVKIDGVVSGCEVVGGASNDNLELAAGVVNVNGDAVTVAEDLTNALTRGAASKYVVHALSVDGSGARTVTAGSPGDTLDMSGGFGGAGQKPLIPVDESLVCYAVTFGNTPAPIPATDIYRGENGNADYRIDSLRGGIILYEALPLCHTGNVGGTIYASFYDLDSATSVIGHLEECTITIKKAAPVATPNHDTNWEQYAPMPTIGWLVDVKRWRPDEFFASKMLDPFQDKFFLKLKEDANDAFTWVGFAILNGDFVISTKRGPVSESFKMTGCGELAKV